MRFATVLLFLSVIAVGQTKPIHRSVPKPAFSFPDDLTEQLGGYVGPESDQNVKDLHAKLADMTKR